MGGASDTSFKCVILGLTCWQCVMFFGLQVDRGNLIQAVSDNMLDDLGLSTNGFTPTLYGNM
jgi:hypothetical protein